MCVAVGKDDKITRYLSWFMLVVNSIFPFVSILVMNVMILQTIKKRPDSKLDLDQEFKSDTSEHISGFNPIAIVGYSNNNETNPCSEVEPKDNRYSISRDRDNKKTEGGKTNVPFQRKTFRNNHKLKRKGDGGQLAFMLLSVSFAFLILTLPLSVRSVVYSLGFFSADSNREHAQTALVVAITSRLMLLNGAINFWLYSIAGKKFRHDLKDIVLKFTK